MGVSHTCQGGCPPWQFCHRLPTCRGHSSIIRARAGVILHARAFAPDYSRPCGPALLIHRRRVPLKYASCFRNVSERAGAHTSTQTFCCSFFFLVVGCECVYLADCAPERVVPGVRGVAPERVFPGEPRGLLRFDMADCCVTAVETFLHFRNLTFHVMFTALVGNENYGGLGARLLHRSAQGSQDVPSSNLCATQARASPHPALSAPDTLGHFLRPLTSRQSWLAIWALVPR